MHAYLLYTPGEMLEGEDELTALGYHVHPFWAIMIRPAFGTKSNTFPAWGIPRPIYQTDWATPGAATSMRSAPTLQPCWKLTWMRTTSLYMGSRTACPHLIPLCPPTIFPAFAGKRFPGILKSALSACTAAPQHLTSLPGGTMRPLRLSR